MRRDVEGHVSDVLVTAYAMWGKAVNYPDKTAVDTAVAAETLTTAAYVASDKIVARGEVWDAKEIRDVRNYLFATYMYMITAIAGNQGSSQTDNVDMADWVENRELSDKRGFLEVLENRIYCREFLDAMPPKGRSVAISRYVLGYSWQETAGEPGSSVNTVQKALSAGVRKAMGTCMHELRRERQQKPVDIESTKRRS